MDVNVRSVVHLTKLAMPYLIQSKGNVINFSADGGVMAFSWGGFANMAKAAINHFTQALALEMGPKGVRVNAVMYYCIYVFIFMCTII